MPSVLLLLLVSLCGCSIVSTEFVPRQKTGELPLWDQEDLCGIPNEVTPGICLPPADCAAYGKINNASSVISIERLSFIKQIQCNSSSAVLRVCCPSSTESYFKPEIKAKMGGKKREAHQLTSDDDSCGKQSYIEDINGGELAEIDESPWMALLWYVRGHSQPHPKCGGSLISRTFVITAAHCVTGRMFYENYGKLAFVRLREYNIHSDPDCVNENDWMNCSDGLIDLTPKDVIPHPMFDSESKSKDNDIALIRIDETPPFNKFLRSICLPEQSYEDVEYGNKQLKVHGFGRTDLFAKELGSDVMSPIKLKLNLKYMDREQCKKWLGLRRFVLKPGQLCAGGEPGKDTCKGDSGSPLVSNDKQRGVWNLVGIVSLGSMNCSKGLPAVYTDVHHYLNWIRETVEAFK
ncbi:CLIP domain-containing serine protease B8-like [Anopheles nili]|uniref:CLIP domain-containing serine protease B8-like n=1 Tax=Anopheles nili TaxID=185578 RepID=UPI00237C29A4|nr:CLIP domain-containing serine protease B8-like [Anopheles nili]